jgi:hypothetical protein
MADPGVKVTYLRDSVFFILTDNYGTKMKQFPTYNTKLVEIIITMYQTHSAAMIVQSLQHTHPALAITEVDVYQIIRKFRMLADAKITEMERKGDFERAFATRIKLESMLPDKRRNISLDVALDENVLDLIVDV